MVQVPNQPTRRVKGEDASARVLQHFPPSPHPSSRRGSSPIRRRDVAEQQPHQADHFVTLRADKHGRLRIQTSSSLKPFEEYIVGGALHRLSECVSGLLASQRDHAVHGALGLPLQLTAPNSTAFMPMEEHSGNLSYPFPQRRAKRRRSSTIAGGRPSGRDNEPTFDGHPTHTKTRKTTEICAGNIVAMEKWYREAFHAVQQVSCRLVAKLWIKRIHHKKQSTHPYNGGHPKHERRDPERTKPDYWPRDVRHKEPDHITRDERVKVLMSIIQMTPMPELNNPNATEEEPIFVSAQQLLEALEERKNEIPDDKWEILQDIAKARSYQERVERQELDAETSVTLIDCSYDPNCPQGETDGETDDNHESDVIGATDGEGENEATSENEPPMTPLSSGLVSPLDRMRQADDQLMQMHGRTVSAAFSESFGADVVKPEERSNRPDARTDDRGRELQDISHNVSPVAEMSRANFEHSLFNTGESLVTERQPHTQMESMGILRLHEGHEPGRSPWPATMPPANMFMPTYASHAGFQSHPMTMDGQISYQGVRFHQNPTPRDEEMAQGLMFPGAPQYPNYNLSDHRHLAVRLANGVRQNTLSTIELEYPSPYY